VFKNNSHAEDRPTENIRDTVFSVSPEELWCGMNSLFVRFECECCLGTKGRRSENSLNMVVIDMVMDVTCNRWHKIGKLE
jgi:hypothetical protein